MSRAPRAREAAVAPGGRHIYPVRVFYEDTDAAGVVYYANYLRFAERARTELLRAFGVSQRALAVDDGLSFAVRRVEADFLAPARLDDALEVVTEVAEVRGASVTMHQAVRRGGEELVRLVVRIGCVNDRARATRLPAGLAAALAGLAAGHGAAGARAADTGTSP